MSVETFDAVYIPSNILFCHSLANFRALASSAVVLNLSCSKSSGTNSPVRVGWWIFTLLEYVYFIGCCRPLYTAQTKAANWRSFYARRKGMEATCVCAFGPLIAKPLVTKNCFRNYDHTNNAARLVSTLVRVFLWQQDKLAAALAHKAGGLFHPRPSFLFLSTIGIYENSGGVARCCSNCWSIANSFVIFKNFSTGEQCVRIPPTCTTPMLMHNCYIVVLNFATKRICFSKGAIADVYPRLLVSLPLPSFNPRSLLSGTAAEIRTKRWRRACAWRALRLFCALSKSERILRRYFASKSPSSAQRGILSTCQFVNAAQNRNKLCCLIKGSLKMMNCNRTPKGRAWRPIRRHGRRRRVPPTMTGAGGRRIGNELRAGHGLKRVAAMWWSLGAD